MAKDGKKRECPLDWSRLEPRRIERKGIDAQVDECPKCKGAFLDAAEVARVTGNRDLAKYLTKYLALDSDSPRVCPRCGGVMDAEQAGSVRVDVCLTCHGVWVDHGEIEALQATKVDLQNLPSDKRAELERAAEVRRRDRRSLLRRMFGLGRKEG